MPIERQNPSQTYTKQEERPLGRLERTRELLRSLWEHWREIFDELGTELESMYRGAGRPTSPPAFMAMATLLQGYAKVSEAAELTVVDLRWQMALDSAPLQGAGRVENTINLLGHAARNVVECAAALLELDADAVAREAGVPLLLASSIERGLDRTWTESG